ncbi:MAG: hypothetical protein QM680_11545 [Luteolibacter sp.]
MTPISFNPDFLIIANSSPVDAINSVSGVFQALALGDNEKSKRYRFCAYGEYPQEVAGVGRIMQVVDKEAAGKMVENFRAFAGLDTFFKGVPVYEGHPDDPAWLAKNPGAKEKAVARIKTIEAGEDGIYVEEVFNSDGVKLLSGEARRHLDELGAQTSGSGFPDDVVRGAAFAVAAHSLLEQQEGAALFFLLHGITGHEVLVKLLHLALLIFSHALLLRTHFVLQHDVIAVAAQRTRKPTLTMDTLAERLDPKTLKGLLSHLVNHIATRGGRATDRRSKRQYPKKADPGEMAEPF